jgi:hypothetical protein
VKILVMIVSVVVMDGPGGGGSVTVSQIGGVYRPENCGVQASLVEQAGSYPLYKILEGRKFQLGTQTTKAFCIDAGD